MKASQSLKFILLLFLALSSIACGDDDEFAELDKTGDLVVNVRDILGASITGETVYLYANEADFNNLLYTTTKVTNNSGQVKFVLLDPGVYYVDCDFENLIGFTTNISGSGSVSAGYETTITISP